MFCDECDMWVYTPITKKALPAPECAFLNVFIFFVWQKKSKLNAKVLICRSHKWNLVCSSQDAADQNSLKRSCVCFSRPCSFSQSCYCFIIILFCLILKLTVLYYLVREQFCCFTVTLKTRYWCWHSKRLPSELSFKMRRRKTTGFIVLFPGFLHCILHHISVIWFII